MRAGESVYKLEYRFTKVPQYSAHIILSAIVLMHNKKPLDCYCVCNHTNKTDSFRCEMHYKISVLKGTVNLNFICHISEVWLAGVEMMAKHIYIYSMIREVEGHWSKW